MEQPRCLEGLGAPGRAIRHEVGCRACSWAARCRGHADATPVAARPCISVASRGTSNRGLSVANQGASLPRKLAASPFFALAGQNLSRPRLAVSTRVWALPFVAVATRMLSSRLHAFAWLISAMPRRFLARPCVAIACRVFAVPRLGLAHRLNAIALLLSDTPLPLGPPRFAAMPSPVASCPVRAIARLLGSIHCHASAPRVRSRRRVASPLPVASLLFFASPLRSVALLRPRGSLHARPIHAIASHEGLALGSNCRAILGSSSCPTPT